MIVGEKVSAFQKVCSCDLQLRRQKNHHASQKKKIRSQSLTQRFLTPYKPNPPSTQAPGHVARGTLASRVKTYIAPYLGRKSAGKNNGGNDDEDKIDCRGRSIDFLKLNVISLAGPSTGCQMGS